MAFHIKDRKKNKRRNALIVFTREPEPGLTKTRLMPYYTPDQCTEIHRCMLRDISRQTKMTDADIIVSHTGGEPSFLKEVFDGGRGTFIRQHGEDLGMRMQNAISDALDAGYEKAVLIGTDVPEIEAESLDAAFALLDAYDLVIGPTVDGGYYLIGMKAVHPEAFNVKTYGTASVFEETLASAERAGLTAGKADTYSDIDTPEDIAGFRQRMRNDPYLRRSCTGRYVSETAGISVIIPVYNESAEICRMLDQLKTAGDGCEVIIVDGGSTDDTVSKIEEYGIFTLLKSSKGRGLQLNRGAAASSGDILFFLHCDSILPDDFAQEIRDVMSGYDWGCFGVSFPSHNLFMLTNRIISNHRAVVRRLPFGDQGIFIDRTLFFETGMFPEIPLMEDYDYSLKLRRYGLIPGMTRGRIVTSARRYGRGTLGILKTEFCMWKLRSLYRKGVSPEILQKYYKDIR